MEPRSKREQQFLSTGKACHGCWVCSAFLQPGQDLHPTHGYGCLRQEKASLAYLQECGNCKYLVRRLCAGHGTVKRNCTLQLMQLSTALHRLFPQDKFIHLFHAWLLPCSSRSPSRNSWGLALLLVRANNWRQSGGVNLVLDFARNPAARAATCVSLCSEKTGRYCPLKCLFNLRYIHWSRRFAIVSSPLTYMHNFQAVFLVPAKESWLKCKKIKKRSITLNQSSYTKQSALLHYRFHPFLLQVRLSFKQGQQE